MLHIIIPVILLILLIVFIAGLIIVLLILTWYFFFNDRNIILGLYEWFGRGVTKGLSWKVVWLVGAQSNVGEALALELANSGAKLILSGKKPNILKKVKANCIEKSKGKCKYSDILVLPFDVTEMDEKYIEEAINHFGKIDVFINNLGFTDLGEACHTSIESDKKVFDVNFFAPVFLTKNMIKHFKDMGGGQIITISNLSGKFGFPGQASASASLQALHGYFESIRLECKKYKIYVTIVCPGLIKTSNTDRLFLVGNSEMNPEELEKMCKKGLKAKRVAHLALVAGVNYCFECSISNQPFLFLVAVAQYFPRIHNFIMSYLFPVKRLERIYEGKSPDFWGWRPMFVI